MDKKYKTTPFEIGEKKKEPTKRAEITILFDVPRAEATQQWMDAVIGIIKREVVADLGKNSAVLGKWV